MRVPGGGLCCRLGVLICRIVKKKKKKADKSGRNLQ